jgi:hypothetical protein
LRRSSQPSEEWSYCIASVSARLAPLTSLNEAPAFFLAPAVSGLHTPSRALTIAQWLGDTLSDAACMLQPMLQVNALRCTFGKGGDAQGVCRVWLCAIVPDRQTFISIDRMVMRPAGFLPAAELNVMELHVAAEFAATHGLGDGLQNWTKQMSSNEFDELMLAS